MQPFGRTEGLRVGELREQGEPGAKLMAGEFSRCVRRSKGEEVGNQILVVPLSERGAGTERVLELELVPSLVETFFDNLGL